MTWDRIAGVPDGAKSGSPRFVGFPWASSRRDGLLSGPRLLARRRSGPNLVPSEVTASGKPHR